MKVDNETDRDGEREKQFQWKRIFFPPRLFVRCLLSCFPLSFHQSTSRLELFSPLIGMWQLPWFAILFSINDKIFTENRFLHFLSFLIWIRIFLFVTKMIKTIKKIAVNHWKWSINQSSFLPIFNETFYQGFWNLISSLR